MILVASWLAAALVAHLATYLIANDASGALAATPEPLYFSLLGMTYAIPFAVGLYRGGFLTLWVAIAFAGLTVAAYVVASLAALFIILGNASFILAGGTSGFIGALLPLFGLYLLSGDRTPGKRNLAVSFTLLLAVSGAVLLALSGAALNPGTHLSRVGGLNPPLLPYLPWQILFGLGAILITRPPSGKIR